MSVSISTDVFCDFCHCWIHGVNGNRAMARAARKAAAAQGWERQIINGEHKDLCPKCVKQRKEAGA